MMRVSPIARAFSRIGIAGSLLGLAGGCADTDDNQVVGPAIVGMSQNTTPFYSDGQVTLYQVQIPVPLRMRTAGELESAALGPMPPFSHTPFVTVEDVETTIRFTLANLDDVPRTIELLVDPWNEFVRYRPQVNAVNEATSPDFSGFDKYFVLGPRARLEGVITPDDTREMAIDLATAQVLIAQPPASAAEQGVNGLVNRAFNLQNRSSAYDPLLTPVVKSIPKIPAMVGFDLGLRMGEAGNIAVEVVVDIRDKQGDRVVPPDGAAKTFGPPGPLLSPPPPTRQ